MLVLNRAPILVRYEIEVEGVTPKDVASLEFDEEVFMFTLTLTSGEVMEIEPVHVRQVEIKPSGGLLYSKGTK